MDQAQKTSRHDGFNRDERDNQRDQQALPSQKTSKQHDTLLGNERGHHDYRQAGS
jgi:hypothetical protein